MEHLQIPVALQPGTFERLFAYLRRQPWEDVHGIIVELSAAARAAVETPPALPLKQKGR